MYKDRILTILRSSKKAFVSGEELASKLGISRTMVWKHIKSLEQDGFAIEAVPSQGYRIISVPDSIRVADIRKGLKTKIIGKTIHVLPQTGSTNTLAMELAANGAPEGTVVIAETQTAGKGRLGRKWASPKGNLYLSVILRPDIPVYKAPLITLMAAVATAASIRAACKLPAAIKWPNDILLSGKKVAGLLTEMSAEPDRVKHVTVGIGIDVNADPAELPDDIRSIATTLAVEVGRKIDRTLLVQQLLLDLEHWYRVFLKNETELLKQWQELNCTIGNRVAVSGYRATVQGIAESIDTEGRLLIRLDDGSLRAVAAGDVTILKGK